MTPVFWHLGSRTGETEFIFNLFHLLLAGLTFLVLLHQLRGSRVVAVDPPDRLLPTGFFMLALNFALQSLYSGGRFFLHQDLRWAGVEPLSRALVTCALLLVTGSYLKASRVKETYPTRWIFRGCIVVAAATIADLLPPMPGVLATEGLHAAAELVNGFLALLAVLLGLRAVHQVRREGRQANLLALVSAGMALLLHHLLLFLPQHGAVVVWNAEQHSLSVALFAFAWAAGERSHNPLDRVFVRLNLTFIILGSLIMLVTTGMEKYQYFRLAEERSMDLAEFLRGHVVYYQARGEHLESIFRHQEVLRRVVVEFGRVPELREVKVYLDGERASFRYTPEWEIKEEIIPLASVSVSSPDPSNSFQMIRLPIGGGKGDGNRIEFVGTIDFINEYISKYIILIYALFTIVVVLASAIIGIIIWDTEQRLRRQYAELQETHQQLAQAAKLASIGQLAAGLAHEINTPITSVLALASHLAEGKSTATLAPPQRKSLQLIVEQTKRVSMIVRNLLTFSRQSRLELSRVDIGKLLETAITLVQHRLSDGAIRLRREINSDLPEILGDPDRLTEVFVNLLNNGIDAMPTGGTLGVRAFFGSEPDGGVRVEVSDAGCGIAPEDLPRIFDPFFTTKVSGRGTGLGLSISHGIVKDHGGQIWAESCPGVGTTLIVILPKEVNRNEVACPGDR